MRRVTDATLEEVLQASLRGFDKGGDLFYDQISALHKAVRGSAPDAALYWFCRMLDGGCDPLYIARRAVRMASEDIGNADPHALPLAVAAMQACEFVGLPECQLTLAQAVTYLSAAPKSNAATVAIGEARGDVLKAIEEAFNTRELFKVKVLDVRTMSVTGKTKRLGRFEGKTAAWKKSRS